MAQVAEQVTAKTAEQVEDLHRKADRAAQAAARAGAEYQEALEGLTVSELRRLIRLRGGSVPHLHRSRENLLARLR